MKQLVIGKGSSDAPGVKQRWISPCDPCGDCCKQRWDGGSDMECFS